jgi:uncharacterized protein
VIRLHLMLAWLAGLLALGAPAHAQTFPALSGRVVDAANLLSPEQEAQLTQLSSEVEQASTRQLVVATVPDLQGHDIADYGYRLLRHWGIGQKGANNGVILIVAPSERRVRIEVGYGLEPVVTDALSSRIINETITPRFKAGDMGGGIVAGAQAIAEQLRLPLEAAEARAQQEAQKTPAPAPSRDRSGGGFPMSLIFWGILFLFVILPMLGLGRRKRRGPWGRRYRGGGGGSAWPIILWSIADEMSRSAHRGGGGWGGGSSGWGGGWGGGGGGFSGGGGSGGGGGASGSW